MSGIAEVLLTLGYKVTGSDVRGTGVTDALVSRGAEVFYKHAGEHVRGAHVVVCSAAVAQRNPEVLAAKGAKIPVISRAEMLAELARLKYTIAVAGTHGKTTTTSMIATILDHAGMDPTFVVGGRLKTVGMNARLGKGEFIVVEADESDRSFLMLSPTIAVVTNVEADHLDNYKDLDDIENTFVSFVNKVPFYGAVVVPSDSESVGRIRERITRRMITFGIADEADVCVSECTLGGLGSRFSLRYNGGAAQSCGLRLPGMFNVLNAAAAFATTFEMGVEPDVIARALEDFEGVERRFEIKSLEPVAVIDDYAHHPTEVRATLGAARAAGFRRVLAAFQPHRYSRTYHLMDDFARAFADADAVLISNIYPAGETPIEGVTGAELVERIKASGMGETHYMPDFAQMESYIREHAHEGDAVVIMGAGNITILSDLLAAQPVEPEPLEVNNDQ